MQTATMLKAIRKKPQNLKQKMNLKLQFQVTQVPPVGWEFLVVIVMSVETGKNIWKSHKSLVQNGTCEWSDSFVEPIKVIQKLESQGYVETLYKFVVSEGSSSSAILGDASFNLVKYASACTPLSIALPLQNCSSGTLLHVKILTESKNSSGMDWHTKKIIVASDNVVRSEDEQSFSDLSGKLSSISDGFELGQHLGSPLWLKAHGQMKYTRPSSFQYNSDAFDEEKSSGTIELGNLASKVFGDIPLLSSPFRKLQNHRQLGKDGSRSSSSSIETSITLEPTIKSALTASQSSITSSEGSSSHNVDQVESINTSWDCFTGAAGDPSQESLGMVVGIPPSCSMHRRNPFPEEPTFSEGANAHHKAGELEEGWHAKRLGSEIEMLKHQISEQLREGAEKDASFLALSVEKDSLKAEVEKLRAEKQFFEDKDHEEVDRQWESEKFKQLIKELKEEVMYEKEKNINLNLQLLKMQDSHVELVQVVEDLERSLEEQRKEMEELLSKQSELQASTCINKHEEEPAYDMEIQELVVQEKKDLSNEIIESLKTEIIRLNKDTEELTREKTDLIIKMNAMEEEVALKHESIEKLWSQMRETKPALSFSDLNLDEVGRFKKFVSNLEEKLQESGCIHKFRSADSESLLLDLQKFLHNIQITNENLNNELKYSEACASSLLPRRITELEAQLRHVKEQRDAYTLERLESVLEEESKEYRSKLLEMEAQNAEVMEESLAHKKAREHLERQLYHLKKELSGQEKVRVLVEQHTEALQGTLEELEELLDKVKRDYLISNTATASLESELKHLQIAWDEKEKKLVEMSKLLLASKHELEQRAEEAEGSLKKMEKEKEAAVGSLQTEVRQLRDQLELLLQSKTGLENTLTEELICMQEKVRQSEIQAAAVAAQCHSIKQEMSVEKAAVEERELKIAKELKDMVLQVDVYRSKEDTYKSQLAQLEIKLADQQKLKNENEELIRNLEMLKIEMDGLSSSLNSTMTAKSEVTFELQRLKTDYAKLEDEKRRLENRVSSLEQPLKEMEELRISKKELQERASKLQAELYEQGTARALEAQERAKSMKLRRQNNEFKNKLLQQKVETEQFRHKMQLLEGELNQKVNALSAIEKKLQGKKKSETGQVKETMELNSLKSKVKLLEDETRIKSLEWESAREEFKKKEFSLCQRIELLTKAHQEFQPLKEETHKTAEVEDEDQEVPKALQLEVARLQQENKQLENRLSQLMEEESLKRFNLENKLADTLKESKHYEVQSQRELDDEPNSKPSTSIAICHTGEVLGLNEQISHLQEELKEMHNRYSSMSLKCVEAEAEREELFLTIRSLRNAKKL